MPATGSERRRALELARGLPGRLSLRLRLTLLYGLCFLVAGAGLLGITYALFAHSQTQVSGFGVGVKVALPSSNQLAIQYVLNVGGAVRAPAAGEALSGAGPHALRTVTPKTAFGTGSGTAQVPVRAFQKLATTDQKAAEDQLLALAHRARVVINTQHHDSLSSLLLWSGVALGVMALISILLGWLVAGRALRPLRTMNQRARQITAESLDQRLGLEARRDELGDLAATFDDLLGRLEGAFASQRRFVANASHELRTPLTLERALVEVALADPDPTVDSLRRACERVLATSQQQERLIDALLTLARGQAGTGVAAAVDLSVLADELVSERRGQLTALTVRTDLEPAPVLGDAALLERLIANLIDNASVHNIPAGWVEVQTGTSASGGFVRVANSGAAVSDDQVPALIEPFRRLNGERTGNGLGLGLSIVNAIAIAHQAALTIVPRPEGGLEVTVQFSPVPAAD